MNTRSVGNKGEDIAAAYLKKHGYTIVERNYNCRFGEIDIIAKQNSYIVFVEVKARSSTAFGMPREAVDWRKQQTIVQCSKLWLTQNKLFGSAVSYDVVEVLNGEVTIIADAFRVPEHIAKRR